MDTQTSEPVRATDGDLTPEQEVLAGVAASNAYAQMLGARVRALRGSLTRAQLAENIGVHPNTIGKFERGESMPDAYLIAKLCQVGRRSAHWFLTGDELKIGTPAKQTTAVEVGGYVYVPHFDVQASAGEGVFNDLEKVVAMRPFDSAFIRGDLRIAHDNLAMCEVIGRSAEPKFSSHDLVLLDCRDRDVHNEGMHVVRMDGDLFIKVLQRLPGRVLRVSSYNTEFSSFDIQGTDDSERDFAVIGRVRWGGVTVG